MFQNNKLDMNHTHLNLFILLKNIIITLEIFELPIENILVNFNYTKRSSIIKIMNIIDFLIGKSNLSHTFYTVRLTWNHFLKEIRKSNSSFIHTHVTSPIKEQQTNMNTKDKRKGN